MEVLKVQIHRIKSRDKIRVKETLKIELLPAGGAKMWIIDPFSTRTSCTKRIKQVL